MQIPAPDRWKHECSSIYCVHGFHASGLLSGGLYGHIYDC